MRRFVLLAAACASTPLAAAPVEIKTTQFGIPHVKASSLADAGYGVGWAFARDNACEFLEEVVTTRGERSYYFGENAQVYDIFSLRGGSYANIVSDTYHRWMFGADAAREQVRGMSPEVRALSQGYVRGFNAYVAQRPQALGERCRGKAWVRPIRIEDVGIRALKFATRASIGYFSEGLGNQTPGAPGAPVAANMPPRAAHDLGSNMIAFGRDMTDFGGGLHFSNPHFPWLGIERLWTVHITVPGKLDVMGGALLGMPLPAAGFNARQGWSLTWADNQRALYHRLSLIKGDPTRYRFDGKSVAMRRRIIRVPLAGGTFRDRVVWETPEGPVLDEPMFPWRDDTAITIADANRDNNRFLNFLYGMATAMSVDDVRKANATTLGNPISNVTSADADGNVIYVNNSVTPDISAGQLSACTGFDLAKTFKADFNIVLLDGSRSACATPREQGRMKILPAERMPVLIRHDYVVHSNNAHMVVNADKASFLTGFSPLVGVESIDALGERTRRALQLAEQRKAGTDRLTGNKMSADTLERLFWQSRLVLADAIVPDLVADCTAQPIVEIEGGTKIDLTRACDVLKAWDRSDKADSIGSHLFGKFVSKLPKQSFTGGTTLSPTLWRRPASPDDVVGTPSGFIVSDAVRKALAATVKEFADAGVPIDAKLGDVQFVERGGVRLPLSGGPIGYNSLHATLSKGVGLTDPIPFADSYMHIVEFRKDGPVARGLLAYSQSTDPASPHHADQTVLYSQQRLAPMPFTADQIAADPEVTTEIIDAR